MIMAEINVFFLTFVDKGGCDSLKAAVTADEEVADQVKVMMEYLGETTDEELMTIGVPRMQEFSSNYVRKRYA